MQLICLFEQLLVFAAINSGVAVILLACLLLAMPFKAFSVLLDLIHYCYFVVSIQSVTLKALLLSQLNRRIQVPSVQRLIRFKFAK